MNFFYRIEGFDLMPGNKTAGFAAIVSTEALQRLSRVTFSEQQAQQLNEQVQRILGRSALIADGATKARVSFLPGTFVPRFFTTDPSLGASIGAAPDDLQRLMKADALEWVGPSVDYTPHNCDAPSEALALFVMFQAWAEEAHIYLEATQGTEEETA